MNYARNPSPIRAAIPSTIASSSLPLKPYNRSHMQPDFHSAIPDAPLAVFPVNGGKPHQGLAGENPAPNQEQSVCKSTVLLGMRGQAELNRIGSCCTGKERDSESGNDYFGARYYASSMGRFLSPDWAAKIEPVPYAKLDNPQSLNLYAYVGNNPLTRFDPDGHYVCSGSKDQCAQIQTGLNLAKAAVKDLGADSKEGKAIQKVIDFYGKAGDKNGVNVSFASMKQGQLGSAELGKDGHSVNIKFDLGQINSAGRGTSEGAGMFSFGLRAGVEIHEGTHGVDERAWGHNPTTDREEDRTEHNAYRNESYTFQGLQFSGTPLWHPGMTEAERNAAIDANSKLSDAASKDN
jgi:RHS repeat-associated protein